MFIKYSLTKQLKRNSDEGHGQTPANSITICLLPTIKLFLVHLIGLLYLIRSCFPFLFPVFHWDFSSINPGNWCRTLKFYGTHFRSWTIRWDPDTKRNHLESQRESFKVVVLLLFWILCSHFFPTSLKTGQIHLLHLYIYSCISGHRKLVVNSISSSIP